MVVRAAGWDLPAVEVHRLHLGRRLELDQPAHWDPGAASLVEDHPRPEEDPAFAMGRPAAGQLAVAAGQVDPGVVRPAVAQAAERRI